MHDRHNYWYLSFEGQSYGENSFSSKNDFSLQLLWYEDTSENFGQLFLGIPILTFKAIIQVSTTYWPNYR